MGTAATPPTFAYRMNKVKYFAVFAALLCLGCEQDIKITTNDKTGEVTITLPAEDTGAAELIQARGMVDASYTLRAKREEMAFNLAQAKLRKSERQFYAVLLVVGVVAGIVSVFSIGMFIIVKRVGRLV